MLLVRVTSQASVAFCSTAIELFVVHIIGFDIADCWACIFIRDRQQRIVTVKRQDQNHKGRPTKQYHWHNIDYSKSCLKLGFMLHDCTSNRI